MREFFFSDKEMGMCSAMEMLSGRSNARALGVTAGMAKLLAHAYAKDYPKSENGKLEFGKVYKTDNENINYYSPNYRVAQENINGIKVPEIRFRWKAGDVADIEETQEVATLEVTIESQSRSGYESLEHELSFAFVYSAIAEDTGEAVNEVSIPFDQFIDQGNGRYLVSMTILGTRNLGLIVSAMTKKECSAKIEITAAAEMVLPDIQYSVDLSTYYSPELHKRLVDDGIVAESIVNRAKIQKIEAQPIKMREPVKVPIDSISRLSIPDPVITIDSGVRRRPYRVAYRASSTGTASPAVVGRPVVNQPVLITQPVVIEPLVTEPITMLQPISVGQPSLIWSGMMIPKINVTTLSAVSPVHYGTLLKSMALSEEGLDEKEIAKAFKESRHSVSGRKALQMIYFKGADGKKMAVVKKISASKELQAYYPNQNYGQIYEEIPDHILDSIFGVADDPTVLQAYQLSVGSKQKVIYQSPQQSNLFYFTPETFKLGRADSPPYEPLMKIGFKELMLEDEDESANLDYRVEVSFTALPDIDPALYTAARADSHLRDIAGGEIVLAPLNTGSATVNIDSLINEYGAEVTAEDISTDAGVMLSFEIGSEHMQKLYATLLPQRASGITGYVRSNLSGGTPKDVKLDISLRDTVGALFSQQYYRNSADAEGLYRVLLTNEIEGEVSVKSSKPWITSTDGSAVSASIQSGAFDAAPGQSKELMVAVEPADASVGAIEVETEHSVVSDEEVLWNLITISNGLSFYSYPVDVEVADTDLFGISPSESVGPLTSLKIEFKEGADVLVSAETPTAQAVLYKSILADLQNKPLTEIYNYRITNMHGEEEGARGNWTQSQGTVYAYPVIPEQAQ